MEPLRTYDYLTLARRRMFDKIRPLATDAYTRQFPIGPGSLARTLTHIMIGEWYYIQRMRRHGTSRVAKAVLIGAVPPLILRTSKNPGGLPMEVFDGIRAETLRDRSQFFKDITIPFYGADRPGAAVAPGFTDAFWLQGMLGGVKNLYDCVKAFSETDFTEDLKKFDVPTLLLHGDDDQFVPIAASALVSAKLIPNATLKVYEGGDHGICATQADRVNADLLAFFGA